MAKLAQLLIATFGLAAAGELATKVIRFEGADGGIHYGQPIEGSNDTAIALLTNDPFDSLELNPVLKPMKVVKLLAPVPMPPAILGIGLNYWGHINASNLSAPQTPSLFFKNRRSYNHPFGAIYVPPSSTLPDYEGELAIIIGKDCKDVSEDDALSCVLGYTVCNDFSARCIQASDPHEADNPTYHAGCKGNGGQFSFSKSLDTHCPLGPAMIPQAVLGDGSGLRVTTWVNDETTPRQNETTSQLIFGVKQIVSFISTGMTIEKGAVFCSGTPDGVGDTMQPPKYMQDGDIVKVNIDKIGSLINSVRRPSNKHEDQPVNLKAIV